MSSTPCSVCHKHKTALNCDQCQRTSCKRCSQFVDGDEYEYLPLWNEVITGEVFCPDCYDENVSPILSRYNDTVDKAKNVDVYTTSQTSATRLIRQIEKPLSIEDCPDREEALMRLAFLAAQKGYGTLINVDIKKKKVGAGSYKKLIWDAFGIPVDPSIRK